MQAHDTSVRVMKWSHNGTWLISGDNGGNVKYWQSNPNNLKLIQAHKEAVRGVIYATKLAISICDMKVDIVCFTDACNILTRFSPSDSKFATCSDDKTIKIWSFNEGSCESVLTGYGWNVKCIDWHPHKSLLVSGSKDNLIKLWDPRMAVAWHPQQEQLFVSGGCSNGSLLWWMANSLKPLASVPNAHDANIWAMDWHPLGHILCTGSNDYGTRFWSRSRPGETSAASNTKNDASATSIQGEDGNQFYLPGFGTIDLSDEYEDEDRNDAKPSMIDKSEFDQAWKIGHSQVGLAGQMPCQLQPTQQLLSHSQHGGRGSPYQRPRDNNDQTHQNRNTQQYHQQSLQQNEEKHNRGYLNNKGQSSDSRLRETDRDRDMLDNQGKWRRVENYRNNSGSNGKKSRDHYRRRR